MEKKDYKKALEDVIDHSIVADLPTDKVWVLLGQMKELTENYERNFIIIHLATNHSTKKHLCQVVLSGRRDHEIKKIMADITSSLEAELEKRRPKKV